MFSDNDKKSPSRAKENRHCIGDRSWQWLLPHRLIYSWVLGEIQLGKAAPAPCNPNLAPADFFLSPRIWAARTVIEKIQTVVTTFLKGRSTSNIFSYLYLYLEYILCHNTCITLWIQNIWGKPSLILENKYGKFTNVPDVGRELWV